MNEINYIPTRKSSFDKFEIFQNHYNFHLKRMYDIFQGSCSTNKQTASWPTVITFDTFSYFVFRNSSKYLSPWL